MSKSRVTLFYRDGANYKATVDFIVDDTLIEAARETYGEDFIQDEEQHDANVEYEDDLGIDQDAFHDAIGWAYNIKYDHHFVIVQKVEPITE